jgi:hypothetical protein
MRQFAINAAIVCTILAAAPVAAVAAEHPAYLHALTDLRHARAHLERRPDENRRQWDEHKAIEQIDAAIAEIKTASIWDGKGLMDHEPVDAKMGYPGRLHRALELLHQAESDCRQEEDSKVTHGLQERALKHIREAIRFTEEGIDKTRG